MTRHPLRPAALIAALAAMSCLAGPADARDPAYVGGGDEAFRRQRSGAGNGGFRLLSHR